MRSFLTTLIDLLCVVEKMSFVHKSKARRDTQNARSNPYRDLDAKHDRESADKIMSIIKRDFTTGMAIMQEGLHNSGDGNSRKNDLNQRMLGAEAVLTGILPVAGNMMMNRSVKPHNDEGLTVVRGTHCARHFGGVSNRLPQTWGFSRIWDHPGPRVAALCLLHWLSVIAFFSQNRILNV